MIFRFAHPLRTRIALVSSSVTLLLICVLLLSSAAGQQPSREPQHFLDKLGFSHDQIAQIEHGDIGVKILKPRKHEVAAVAVVRIQASQEFFIDRVRDIERYKKSEAVLLSKKFSNPPEVEDLAILTLPPQEIRDLAACEPGQCHFKLSRRQMELLQKLDFSAPDIEQQANAAMRAMLRDYARAYEADGNRAMIVYADRGKGVDCAAQFAEILDRSTDILLYALEFGDCLPAFQMSLWKESRGFFIGPRRITDISSKRSLR